MATNSAEITKPLFARFDQWAKRVALGRKLAIALTVAALGSSLATYAAFTGLGPLRTDLQTMLILLNLDLVLFLILAAIVARRLVRVWMERRRGAVGSRLHIRLVVLFSLVAVTPTIIVSVSSALFFSLGIQAWFSDKVRTALKESDAVAAAYLKEHQQTIRGDILAMARDLSRAAPLFQNDPARLRRIVATQGTLRSLSEAAVFDSTGRVLARWNNLGFNLFDEPVPIWALDRARQGEPVMMTTEADDRIRALVKLDRIVDVFLYVSRFVEPGVLNHIERTRSAVKRYEELEGKRSSIEITFAMMFVLVALLLLMAAIWIGLNFATRLARPISDLVNAAERVRGGDLAARVDEASEADEIGTLNRAFNRMTEQLDAQRSGLVEANRQLDERRHFMETVLAGVSSGVIGLDEKGRINVANRSAIGLLSIDGESAVGQRLDSLIPECGDLLKVALDRPDQAVNGQIVIRRTPVSQTLLVRLAPESDAGEGHGYVATFDDITELLSAQRKAAWSDVARRIAHEIKNPLTPIQLAAERLRRKYSKEINSDPDTFVACTDTIIRQVGDLGRLVDEFSSFARMPAPVMKREDLAALCGDSKILLESAHGDISFTRSGLEGPVELICDRRQIGQALTNLMQNAVDAIEARRAGPDAGPTPDTIDINIERREGHVTIAISDTGVGLPQSERDRLTEPYVTTREKGTGLGLAIVRKIMEDHGGLLSLEDRDGGGARVSLTFPETDSGLTRKQGRDKKDSEKVTAHGA